MGVIIGVVGGRLLVRSKTVRLAEPHVEPYLRGGDGRSLLWDRRPARGERLHRSLFGGLTYGRSTDGELGDNEQFADDFGKVMTQIAFMIFGAVGLGFAFEG